MSGNCYNNEILRTRARALRAFERYSRPIMKPEDILTDDVNVREFGSETVRKGSVGAFLANARIIEENPVGSAKYNQAVSDLIALIPKLKALGLFDFFDLKPGKVRQLIEESL